MYTSWIVSCPKLYCMVGKDSQKNRVRDFFNAYTQLVYKKGEMILRAEDPPLGVYYIEKGVVRQYVINGVGEMLMIQLYRPGAFFPMTWVINDTTNRYFYESATPLSVRRAPREDFKQFLNKHPEILAEFVGRLLIGIVGLWSRVEHLVLETAYAKTILLILYYATRFGRIDDAHVTLDLSLTHREVAAWIGTTRETASLQMEELKKKKLLLTRGRQLIIPSLINLEKELSLYRHSHQVHP